MPMPLVYGSYSPEPTTDSCFTSIANAADEAMFAVLTEDLDPLDVADADDVSLDAFYEADAARRAARDHEATVAAFVDAYYADLAA